MTSTTPSLPPRSLPPLATPPRGQDSPAKPKKKKKKPAESEEPGPDASRETPGKKPARRRPRSRAGSEIDSGAEGDPEAFKPTPSPKPKAKKTSRTPGEDSSEPQEAGSAKKPKKGKRPLPSSLDANNEEPGSPGRATLSSKPPTGKKGGKVKKKKTRARDSIDGGDFYEDEGEVPADFLAPDDADLISPEEETEAWDVPVGQNTLTLPSQPINKVFMERKSGFKSELKSRVAKSNGVKSQPRPVRSIQTTTEVALGIHGTYLALTLFCHGVLAGFAMWHAVIVYTLTNSSNAELLYYYSPLARPAAATFYLLLAICTVSVFDRYDVGKPDARFFRGLLTFQSGASAIIVYFATLVVSTSIASMDDRISLYCVSDPLTCIEDEESLCFTNQDLCINQDLWSDDSILNTWRILNLVRVVGCMLGWLIVSLTPTTDYLSEHLQGPENELSRQVESIEMKGQQSAA